MEKNLVLTITKHDGSVIEPFVLDGVKLTIQRRSTPSKLTFEILKGDFVIEEGSQIDLSWKSSKLFKGYIFSYSFDKNDTISITAYDQLRYLKNKDTYVFESKTASQIIQSIAGDFNLKTGSISATAYAIPNYPCDNMSLYDIIEGALDETIKNTKQLYVFFDKAGELTLKSLSEMKVDGFIATDANTVNYDFKSSIDDNTYNKIKLYSNNEEQGVRDIYIEEDSSNQKKWGTLQLYEEVKKGENGKIKAQTLLKLYNAPTRSMSLNDIEGDVNVRAGSLVLVKIDIGNNINLCNYMLVESCVHTFSDSDHRMSLNVKGGKLNG